MAVGDILTFYTSGDGTDSRNLSIKPTIGKVYKMINAFVKQEDSSAECGILFFRDITDADYIPVFVRTSTGNDIDIFIGGGGGEQPIIANVYLTDTDTLYLKTSGGDSAGDNAILGATMQIIKE